MYFEMLYMKPLPSTNFFSNHAATHARRVTVMPKDSRFIRDIIKIWEPNAWITEPPRCFPGRVRGPRMISRRSGGKTPVGLTVIRNRQMAARSTGRKAPNVRDKLHAKANRI